MKTVEMQVLQFPEAGDYKNLTWLFYWFMFHATPA